MKWREKSVEKITGQKWGRKMADIMRKAAVSIRSQKRERDGMERQERVWKR